MDRTERFAAADTTPLLITPRALHDRISAEKIYLKFKTFQQKIITLQIIITTYQELRELKLNIVGWCA